MARLDPFFLRGNRQFDLNQSLFNPFDIGSLVAQLHDQISRIMEAECQTTCVQALQSPNNILHILQVLGPPQITREDCALPTERIEISHQLVGRDIQPVQCRRGWLRDSFPGSVEDFFFSEPRASRAWKGLTI